MARLRTNVLKWGNKYDGPNDYKHGRQGALEDAFWAEDELVEHRHASRRKAPKKKRGCPENDYKAHVYVWVTETRFYSKWKTGYGFVRDKSRPYTVHLKTCCGCGKVCKTRYDW